MRAALLLLPTVLLACSSSGSDGKGAKVNLALSVVRPPTMFRGPARAKVLAPSENVSATGAGLESMKLHINTIKLCESVTLNGTAWTDTQGCLDLYHSPPVMELESGSPHATQMAAAATASDYIDVLSATDRATLARTVTLKEGDARSYNYVILNWPGPIKVKATLTDPADGTTPVLYTKPGTSSACNTGFADYSCVVSSTPLTAGPAEEAIFYNGGNIVLKFQKPLVVTADDVSSGAEYNLMLAFNPDGLIQGVTAPGATNYAPLGDGANFGGGGGANSIALVSPQLAPIFYKTGTQVMRESYSATIPNSSGGTFKLRVELFSLSTDPDRTIYGVTTATIPTADTSGYLVGFDGIFAVTAGAAADSVNLLDYQANAQLTDLVRITTEGATTTATVRCNEVLMSGCLTGDPVAATFTLDAYQPIE